MYETPSPRFLPKHRLPSSWFQPRYFLNCFGTAMLRYFTVDESS
jgi:hypothetical protein